MSIWAGTELFGIPVPYSAIMSYCTSCQITLGLADPLGAPSPSVKYHSFTQVLIFLYPELYFQLMTLARNFNHLACILFCVAYTCGLSSLLSACKTLRLCKSTISIVPSAGKKSGGIEISERNMTRDMPGK